MGIHNRVHADDRFMMSSISDHYEVNFDVTKDEGLNVIRYGLMQGVFKAASGTDRVNTLNYLHQVAQHGTGREETHQDIAFNQAAARKMALYIHLSPCHYEYVEPHENAQMKMLHEHLRRDVYFNDAVHQWAQCPLAERLELLNLVAQMQHIVLGFKMHARAPEIVTFSMSRQEHWNFLQENNLPPEEYPMGQAVSGIPTQHVYPGIPERPGTIIALNIHHEALCKLINQTSAFETAVRLHAELYQNDLKAQLLLGQGPNPQDYTKFLKGLSHKPSAWEDDPSCGRLFKVFDLSARHCQAVADKFTMIAKTDSPNLERWSLTSRVQALQRPHRSMIRVLV